MATLPDFLMAGGTESEWEARHAEGGTDADQPLPLLGAVVEEAEEEEAQADDQTNQSELLLDKPTEEEQRDEAEAQAEARAAEPEGDDDSATAPPTGRPASLLGPLASKESHSALLDEEDLCVGGGAAAAGVGPGAVGGDGEELVEFEILIDGEVVGSTFLPKPRNEAEAALSDEAVAKAIKDARRRKFEERLGIAPGASAGPTAAETAAAAGPFVPQPPALCNSCQKNNAKYKCPKCDTGSCCLACVNAHKSSTGCTGKRARSSYVPLTRMNETTLANDLGFLNDMERMAGAAARDQRMQDAKGKAIVIEPTANAAPAAAAASGAPAVSVGDMFGCTAAHLDRRSFTLMSACQQYRNCKLMMMPQGMKMHTQNTSRVCTLPGAPAAPAVAARPGRASTPNLSLSASCIRWTVHLLFKHRALTQAGPNSDLRIVKHKVDERTTWGQLLDSVMQAAPPVALTSDATMEEEAAKATTSARKATTAIDSSVPALASTSTALLRHQLAAFMPPAGGGSTSADSAAAAAATAAAAPSSPYSHLALLLPVPFQPANAPLFHRVPPWSSIVSSLQNKILVEHPVLWLVAAQDLADGNKYAIAPEPTFPKKKAQQAEGAQGPPPPRKKRKVAEGATTTAEGGAAEGGANATVDATSAAVPDSATTSPAAAAAAAASSSNEPVAARPAPASAMAFAPPRSATDAPHADSGHRGRGGRGGGHRGGGGGGGWDREGGGGRGGGGRGGGRGRGGRGGGSGGGNFERGRGRGGRGGAAPAFAFGVAKPAEPSPPPLPPPPPPPPTQPSLFKKWT